MLMRTNHLLLKPWLKLGASTNDHMQANVRIQAVQNNIQTVYETMRNLWGALPNATRQERAEVFEAIHACTNDLQQLYTELDELQIGPEQP